jgi:hypothetical protein
MALGIFAGSLQGNVDPLSLKQSEDDGVMKAFLEHEIRGLLWIGR